MADYLPILAKLVDGLTDAESRQTVYTRARVALGEQLKGVEPPLSEEMIARETSQLEDAVRQLEERHARGGSAAAFTEPSEGPLESPAGRPGIERGSARRGRSRPPRPDTVPIRRGGRRKAPVVLLAVLSLVAVPVAIVAWFWRGSPPSRDAETITQQATTPASPAADTKYNERVAGGSAPPSQGLPTPPRTVPAAAAPADIGRGPTAPTGSSADLSVAQRALLFEENPADSQKPTVTSGRALWRIDALAGGQGMPLETVVRGTIEFPAAGLGLNLVVRRNTDSALPASHTIELSFASIPTPTGPARIVRDVALPQMRPEEAIRGIAVAGLPVPVKENIFLVGLSDLKGDIERNTELLLRRNWMELPIRFASGQKAALLVDKGISGDRVFQDAFRQWGQTP